MSEPTREEILAVLEAWKKEFSKMQIWYEIDEELYQAIRRLIEARPEVTRDFVQKWAERMSFDTGSILGKVKPQIYQLEEMLKEAGVEMEEEYKEA